MRSILLLFAKLNPAVGYVQGMNEVLAPLFYVFSSDPDAQQAVSLQHPFSVEGHLEATPPPPSVTNRRRRMMIVPPLPSSVSAVRCRGGQLLLLRVSA